MKIKPSILSSFNLFLSFVINSPMAENALSGSTDVGLIVSKAQYSFILVVVVCFYLHPKKQLIIIEDKIEQRLQIGRR